MWPAIRPATPSWTALPAYRVECRGDGMKVQVRKGYCSATGTNNAAGAVVGKLGNQPIRTTGVPGVLLASNTPSGASKLSGVFVAANSDVKLSGGTQVVLEVAPAAAQ
jgi:hypothetical protein